MRKLARLFELCIVILVGSVYLTNQAVSIYGGDAGDLVSAALVGGIAHPPGYPLYVILGHLLTLLPLSTVAWRVTLLSSFPMALASWFLYRTLLLWFKQPVIAFVASLSFSFSYLVWLFASVPEVFGLYVFFISLLFWLLSKLLLNPENRDRRKKLLTLVAFIFGLALSHHHAILFFVPAFGYLLWLAFKTKRQRQIITLPLVVICISLFLAGLIPYLQPILASRSGVPVFWNRPNTFAGFIRLLTRAEYGTFVPGSFVSRDPLYRLGLLLTFLETLYYDFALLGMLLIAIGLVWLFRKQRQLGYFFLLAVGIGGVTFSMYASFPVHINFVIATYERFLLPSYLFLTIPMTAGFLAVSETIKTIFGKINKRFTTLTIFTLAIPLIFIIYPLRLLKANYPKIQPLRNDKTADYFGEDVLGTAPPGAIVALSDDTFLFNGQYIYYSDPRFADRFFFHLDKLAKAEHRAQLSRLYPLLTFPESDSEGYTYLRLFILANIDKHPFLTNDIFGLPPELEWQQYGLLKRVYSLKVRPTKDILLAENEALWFGYHDPLTSQVLFDHHLLLRDVLRAYGNGRRKLGEIYLDMGRLADAERHLRTALNLEPWWWANNLYLGRLRAKQGDCQAAEEQLLKVKREVPQEDETYTLLSDLYASCFHNEVKAAEYRDKVLRRQKDRQIPLEKL